MLRQTLTVLNPMARIDQHIMDDADLAGPFLFCGLFGTFLLLVSTNFIDHAWSGLINVFNSPANSGLATSAA